MGKRFTVSHHLSHKMVSSYCHLTFLTVVIFKFQIFVIPVLIGLLFELLVIVPMRVPIDESPVFLLYQDWALGLIFLKIWTRLVPFCHFLFLLWIFMLKVFSFLFLQCFPTYHQIIVVESNEMSHLYIKSFHVILIVNQFLSSTVNAPTSKIHIEGTPVIYPTCPYHLTCIPTQMNWY